MKRLPAIADMGFDILYLPPIHPIGTTHRKGPNNTLDAGPYDPGSPWAIGSPDGGHDTIHPDLGTLADFDAFVDYAGTCGLKSPSTWPCNAPRPPLGPPAPRLVHHPRRRHHRLRRKPTQEIPGHLPSTSTTTPTACTTPSKTYCTTG